MNRTVNKSDTYVSKIAKYVPAESIVLASGFFAAFTGLGKPWVLVAVAIFAVLNFVYLFGVGHVNDEQAPPMHFYVLSALAFLLWSSSQIDAVAAVVGLEGTSSGPQRAWVLGVATGLIPLLDSAAENSTIRDAFTPRRRRGRDGDGATDTTVGTHTGPDDGIEVVTGEA